MNERFATARPARREAPAVFVVGFWKRLVAAAIDLAIVIPAALLLTLVISKIAGVIAQGYRIGDEVLRPALVAVVKA